LRASREKIRIAKQEKRRNAMRIAQRPQGKCKIGPDAGRLAEG
jgi:hypothetical protein